MTVTIYHNPACGTSRNTLAMIMQSGDKPEEHLKNLGCRPRGHMPNDIRRMLENCRVSRLAPKPWRI